MTQEKDVKRPIQELEHAPIAKIDTPERDQTETNNKTHQALKTALTLAERVQRQPMIAHLIRAAERFNDRMGNQFGAAITYFSFLSMIPILMVSFAAAGFILASHPTLLQDIFSKIGQRQRSDAGIHAEKHHQYRRSATYHRRAGRAGYRPLLRG